MVAHSCHLERPAEMVPGSAMSGVKKSDDKKRDSSGSIGGFLKRRRAAPAHDDVSVASVDLGILLGDEWKPADVPASSWTAELKAELDLFNASIRAGHDLPYGAGPPVLVPLFRGYTFDKAQAVRHRQRADWQEYPPELSQAALVKMRKAGICGHRGVVQAGTLPKIKAIIREVRRACERIRAKPSARGLDRSLLDDWWERYFNSMASHRSEDMKSPAAKRVDVADTPFLSFSEGPNEPIYYGAAMRLTQENFPKYAADGSLKHPHVGSVVAVLMTPQQIRDLGYQVRRRQTSMQFALQPKFVHNVEVTVLGGLESEFVAARELISFPDLSRPYQPIYEHYYGLSAADFDLAKAKLAAEFVKHGKIVRYPNGANKAKSKKDADMGLLEFLTSRLAAVLAPRLMVLAEKSAQARGCVLANLMPDGTYQPAASSLKAASSAAVSKMKGREASRVVAQMHEALLETPTVQHGKNTFELWRNAVITDAVTKPILRAGEFKQLVRSPVKSGLSCAMQQLQVELLENDPSAWPVYISHKEFKANCLLPHGSPKDIRRGPKLPAFKKDPERWLYEMLIRHLSPHGVPVPRVTDEVIAKLKKKKIIWILDGLSGRGEYSAEQYAALKLMQEQGRVVMATHDLDRTARGFDVSELPAFSAEQVLALCQHARQQHPLGERIKPVQLSNWFDQLSPWLDFLNHMPALAMHILDVTLADEQDFKCPAGSAASVYQLMAESQVLNQVKRMSSVRLAAFWQRRLDGVPTSFRKLAENPLWVSGLTQYLIELDIADKRSIDLWKKALALTLTKSQWQDLLWLLPVMAGRQGRLDVVEAWLAFVSDHLLAVTEPGQQLQLLKLYDVASAFPGLPLKKIEMLIANIVMAIGRAESIEENMPILRFIRKHKAVRDGVGLRDELSLAVKEVLMDKKVFVWIALQRLTASSTLSDLKVIEVALSKCSIEAQKEHLFEVVGVLANLSRLDSCFLRWLAYQHSYLGLVDYADIGRWDMPALLRGYDTGSVVGRFYQLAMNFAEYGLPAKGVNRLMRDFAAMGVEKVKTVAGYFHSLKDAPQYNVFWQAVLARPDCEPGHACAKAKLAVFAAEAVAVVADLEGSESPSS